MDRLSSQAGMSKEEMMVSCERVKVEMLQPVKGDRLVTFFDLERFVQQGFQL